MTLGAGQGTKLILSVDGKDENEAIEELFNLISSGFGEL
jgi:phosphotransferase system HPr-like phosphotransfer protein